MICCCGVQAGSATEDSKAYLKVWTNLSAKPLDDGWYEDTNILGIPFCCRNSLYSTDWKGGLSLTIWAGRPYLAKTLRKALQVAPAVVVFIGPNTSGHLE